MLLTALTDFKASCFWSGHQTVAGPAGIQSHVEQSPALLSPMRMGDAGSSWGCQMDVAMLIHPAPCVQPEPRGCIQRNWKLHPESTAPSLKAGLEIPSSISMPNTQHWSRAGAVSQGVGNSRGCRPVNFTSCSLLVIQPPSKHVFWDQIQCPSAVLHSIAPSADP